MIIEVESPSKSVASLPEVRRLSVGGRSLPESFCRFSSSFGYGRFGRLVIVYSAVMDHPDSIFNQGNRVKGFIDEAVAEDYFEFDPDGSESQMANLFPFAASENGEYFVWDMGSPHHGEYPIYCIGARMAGMRFAAFDLDNLLEKLSGEAIKDVMGPGYAALPPVFEGM